jgi:hypothetical protein
MSINEPLAFGFELGDQAIIHGVWSCLRIFELVIWTKFGEAKEVAMRIMKGLMMAGLAVGFAIGCDNPPGAGNGRNDEVNVEVDAPGVKVEVEKEPGAGGAPDVKVDIQKPRNTEKPN